AGAPCDSGTGGGGGGSDGRGGGGGGSAPDGVAGGVRLENGRAGVAPEGLRLHVGVRAPPGRERGGGRTSGASPPPGAGTGCSSDGPLPRNCSSAPQNSAASEYRSSTSRSSERMRISSSIGSTPGRASDSGLAGSESRFIVARNVSSPEKGSSPESAL